MKTMDSRNVRYFFGQFYTESKISMRCAVGKRIRPPLSKYHWSRTMPSVAQYEGPYQPGLKQTRHSGVSENADLERIHYLPSKYDLSASEHAIR